MLNCCNFNCFVSNLAGANKIKFMNGQVFKGFQLLEVRLGGNECIDSYSHPKVDKKEFLSEVSKKCGFAEIKSRRNQISCLYHTIQFKTHFVFCVFKNSSVINSTDFFISDRRHDGVNSISFHANSKIEFLPVSIFLKFSNVQSYDADRCSIQEISKKNFEHLLKLRSINLSFNRIKTIKHDTFERLPKLETILLSNFFYLLRFSF